jgi:drug/metabolite transporter (DMT)-like permease
LLLGERITPMAATGCAAILIGVIWAGRAHSSE